MKLKHNLWEPLISDGNKPSYRMIKHPGTKGKPNSNKGIWWLDYMDNGKRIRMSLSTRDKREADKRRKIWIKYCETHGFDSAVNLAEFVEKLENDTK